MNPVQQLSTLGQSPWLDFIRRSFVQDGSLKRLIDEDGVRGVTSNPAIFEAAITGNTDYDEAIIIQASAGKTPLEIYDILTIEDVGAAADLFKGVFHDTKGLDGYVSLEVSPLLAHDTEATIADARRLWKALNRPNVMIKVPATQAGLPAIKTLIADGININVTLIFSLTRYKEVAEAFILGLEQRAAKGESLEIASVASFFVSRMDTMIDPMIEAKGATDLEGEIAVANAQAAYGIYQDIFHGPRFAALAAKGAWSQRVLWASTSTKNPAFAKTKYVEALIGKETVNTLPLQTIEDYRVEGHPADRLAGSRDAAAKVLAKLESSGINLEEVCQALEDEAIKKFVDPFHKLIAAIETKRDSVMAGR